LPTYEYACTACGHRLDAVQKFTDDPLTECPECGGALRKVYGAVGIVLKGSGFYKNDSRAASTANGSGKKSSESQSSDTSGGDSASKDASAKKETGSDTSGSEKSTTSKDATPASTTAS
jgi:putative FmdB family regulatory protein